MKKMTLIAAMIAAMFWAEAQGYFTGEGGAGLSISVEKPKVQNVGEDLSWLPDYANNVISDCLKKYSRIGVIERRYEGAVSSALAREEGAEYANDGAEVGKWKTAKNQLQVSIIGKPRSYNVSATVIDKETLTSQASFNEDCTYDALESGAVLGKTVSSLLGQLGVVLTDKAKGELLLSSKAGSGGEALQARSIEAQKLVARAQQAEAAGANIEALRLSMAASRQDVNLERAAVTKSRVSQAVVSSDMGANVRNAIKRRDEMAALIKETEEYYEKHSPYTLVYDPDLQQGYIDYSNRRFEVKFKAAVILSFNAVEDFLIISKALEANPEWKGWGLKPAKIFPFGCVDVNISVLNAKDEVVGTSKSYLNAHGGCAAKIDGRTIYSIFGSGTFSVYVNADKDTDGMFVRIDSTEGRPCVYKDTIGTFYGPRATNSGGPAPYFTVADYCTQVWQGYVDSGTALPLGIEMLEKYFRDSAGFKRPIIKAAGYKGTP